MRCDCVGRVRRCGEHWRKGWHCSHDHCERVGDHNCCNSWLDRSEWWCRCGDRHVWRRRCRCVALACQLDVEPRRGRPQRHASACVWSLQAVPSPSTLPLSWVRAQSQQRAVSAARRAALPLAVPAGMCSPTGSVFKLSACHRWCDVTSGMRRACAVEGASPFTHNRPATMVLYQRVALRACRRTQPAALAPCTSMSALQTAH